MSEPGLTKLEVHALPVTAGGVVTWHDYYLASDVDALLAQQREALKQIDDISAYVNGQCENNCGTKFRSLLMDAIAPTERPLA